MILTFGKHKNEILENTPKSYIKWLASHKNVLSPEHRYISDAAKAILERMAQVDALEAYEARKEAEMAVKVAEQLIRANQGIRSNLNTSRAFSLMR